MEPYEIIDDNSWFNLLFVQLSANTGEYLDGISNILWKYKWLKMTPEELENLK